MVNTIKIFNPKEYPFGKLSINNRDDLYIDNNSYPTVSNYIHSNLLRTPLFKQVVQNLKLSELEKEFNNLLKQETLTIVKKAIEVGLDAKIEGNKDMQEALLSTKNEPISYVSTNTFTGVGDDSKGLNIVGKYLEQKRRQIEISFKESYTEKKKQEWEHALYESYIADLALNKAIKNGNDLTEYMGKNPTEIIDMIGRAEVVSSGPHKKFIIEDLYKKQRYKNLIPKEIILAIDNPESLVYSIRKKQLGQLRKRQLILKKETVLYMYCEYVLEKEFPDLPKEKYDEAIKEQYLKYGWVENDISIGHSKLDLANKVYEMYEKGMFSERLSTNMDNALATIKVPTETEVIQAEVYIISASKKEEPNILPYQKPEGKPVFIYEDIDKNEDKFKPFSLLDFSKLMKIGLLDLVYPTILHYMYVCLLANLPGINTIKDAYQYIIADADAPLGVGRFKNPDIVGKRYSQEKTERMDTKKIKLAEQGLNVKFTNRVMQDLLLDTKNNALVWNNFNDPILGSGKNNQGMNTVGRYMMQIRSAIVEQRKTETFDKLSEKDVNNLLERDSLIRAWLEMRVKDMCKAIITVKNYKYYKTNENVKIDAVFVKYVLDHIYQPCAELFAASSEIKMETPEWFKGIVYSCPGFSTKKKVDKKAQEVEMVDSAKIIEKELKKAFEEMDDEEDDTEEEDKADAMGVSDNIIKKEQEKVLKGMGEEKPTIKVTKRPGIAGKMRQRKDTDTEAARIINKKQNDDFVFNLLKSSKNRMEDLKAKTKAKLEAEKEAQLQREAEKEAQLQREADEKLEKFLAEKTSAFPIGLDVIDVIWKRIAVMIWYLIKYLNETTIQNVRRVLISIEQLTSKEKPCEKIISGTLDNCIVSAILNILQNLISFNEKYSLVQDIDKIDVETAVSIILNKDMKGLLELRPEMMSKSIFEEEDPYQLPNDDLEEKMVDDVEYEYDVDVEESEEEDVNDDDDDDDFEDEEGDDDDGFGDIYSPNQSNKLMTRLSMIPEVKDVNEIYLYIMSAVEVVKTQKMSKNIKINRINFFATQK